MSALNHGGEAFPHQPASSVHGEQIMYGATGMTMRQYYKAAALQGLLASGMLATKPRGMEMGEMCAGIISSASEFADHLIAEDIHYAGGRAPSTTGEQP